MLRNEETEASLLPQPSVSPLPPSLCFTFFPNTVQPLSLFQQLSSDSPEHPAVFPLPLPRTHHPFVWPPWHTVCPALCRLFWCLWPIPQRSQVLVPECYTGLCSPGASTQHAHLPSVWYFCFALASKHPSTQGHLGPSTVLRPDGEWGPADRFGLLSRGAFRSGWWLSVTEFLARHRASEACLQAGEGLPLGSIDTDTTWSASLLPFPHFWPDLHRDKPEIHIRVVF